MIQIIGANLDLAMKELPVTAEKKFEAEPDFLDVALQVWELSDEDFAYLCNIEPEDWLDEHGWWVNGGCNHPKQDVKTFTIKNEDLTAFADDPADVWLDEYINLEDYFESYIGISKYNNKAYYIHSLAELNSMTKAEFMHKFW